MRYYLTRCNPIDFTKATLSEISGYLDPNQDTGSTSTSEATTHLSIDSILKQACNRYGIEYSSDSNLKDIFESLNKKSRRGISAVNIVIDKLDLDLILAITNRLYAESIDSDSNSCYSIKAEPIRASTHESDDDLDLSISINIDSKGIQAMAYFSATKTVKHQSDGEPTTISKTIGGAHSKPKRLASHDNIEDLVEDLRYYVFNQDFIDELSKSLGCEVTVECYVD